MLRIVGWALKIDQEMKTKIWYVTCDAWRNIVCDRVYRHLYGNIGTR